MKAAWEKCFELQAGQPTGRWQWVCGSHEGDYFYPGHWLNPDTIAVPPALEQVSRGALQ